MVVRPSADTVLVTQRDSVLSRRFQYPHVLWKTLWFLFYAYECDLHCACWCPAPMVVRPSVDTVLITQLDSVLPRFRYSHVLWKTLWFLFYAYECDLHCACWFPAPMDARPSADTVLITQLDITLSRFLCLRVLLMNIVVAVLCIWMWSLLCLLMLWLPWLPVHLQAQHWSPNWILPCQSFSIHV